jgi:hypothetical protein
MQAVFIFLVRKLPLQFFQQAHRCAKVTTPMAV